jgi:uncharacterized protein YwqG
MNQDDLKSMLEMHGLGNMSDAILAAARKCVRFEGMAKESPKAPVGTSKLGGQPDLPEILDWPLRDGRPLAFLAQIALSHLPTNEESTQLPRSGLLSFFFDVVEQPWGFDPKDAGSSRVLYSQESMRLERTAMPSELPDEAQFAELSLSQQEHYSLPGWEREEAQSLDLNEQQMEAYDLIRSALSPEFPSTCHQLLGWPDEIQGPMELECQLASHGLYCGNATGYSDRRAAEIASGAIDWRLLLQLDSDDRAGMMWGDAGRLYFWIREQDLVEHSFDSTWTILQCY